MSFTLGEEPPLTLGEELQTARYRLYRSQILQEHMRWKALAEIYTMLSFAPLANLSFFVKSLPIFANFLPNLSKFANSVVLPKFCYILTKILRLETGAKECIV